MTLGVCLLLSVLDCSRSIPRPGFVFTQCLATDTHAANPADILDLRYSAGSRVMFADADFKRLDVISEGLFAAGDPLVTCDGKRVLFCAKAKPGSPWQVYEARLGHRGYRPLTAMPGGAANPALLPDGRLVFTSTR